MFIRVLIAFNVAVPEQKLVTVIDKILQKSQKQMKVALQQFFFKRTERNTIYLVPIR